MKVLKSKFFGFILLVASIGIAIFVCVNRGNAKEIGQGIGSSMGAAAGKAIGSLEGITVGRREGTAAGKEKGLSAEDTKADIANEFKNISSLEVLTTSVKLRNFHTIGKRDDVDYAALYLVNGNVVFTVDLSRAEITDDGEMLNITVPIPKGSLYVDEKSINKVDEYQKKIFNGSAEDGYKAYLNTMKGVTKATTETLDNYDQLIEAAKEAARNQITLLAQSVTISDKKINIDFTSKEDE